VEELGDASQRVKNGDRLLFRTFSHLRGGRFKEEEAITMKRITLILTFLLLWTMVCGLCAAHADIPHLIAYQGRLTDSQGTPREGSYSVTFRIYNAESGGVLRWQETHSNVTVRSGIFDILLGSVSPINLPFNEQYYLAIQVGSDAEMTPRQQIASVGYAYKAEKAEQADIATIANIATNADTVDGIHASTTPEPNKLLALDANSSFPTSVMAGGNLISYLYVGSGGFDNNLVDNNFFPERCSLNCWETNGKMKIYLTGNEKSLKGSVYMKSLNGANSKLRLKIGNIYSNDGSISSGEGRILMTMDISSLPEGVTLLEIQTYSGGGSNRVQYSSDSLIFWVEY